MNTKIDRTIERLETALMIRPDDRHQRVQLGRAYQQAKRFSDAEEAYQRVLKVEPTSAEALFSLGLLRSEQGRADESIDLFRRAVAADSEHIGARRALAEHSVQNRDLGQARAHYEELVRLQPRESEALRALASVLVALGDDARAAELLERALELAPSDLACVAELCASWFRLAHWSRIHTLALPLVDDAQLSAVVLDQLGHATRELGAIDDAERAFRSRLGRGETTEAHGGLAWVYLQRKRYHDVIKQLEKVTSPSLETWYLRGQAYFHLSKWEEAVDSLRQAADIAPGDGLVHHWLGLSLLEIGRLDNAVTHLRHAVRYLPRSVDSWVGLAQALVKLDQLDTATEPMQQAIEIEPEKALHHARLGQHQVRLGRFDLAQVCFARAVELLPFQGEYWVGLGETRIRLEQFHAAEQDLVRATQLLPSNAPALAALGLARSRIGKLPEAVVSLEQAVHLDASDLASRLGLARALIALGRFSDALVHLEKTPPAQATSTDLAELSGQAYFELRRYEDATAALLRRTSSPNPSAASWAFLGLSLEQLGKAAEAEAALGRAVELDGVATAALAGLGRCRLALRNPGGAIEPFERLVRLLPRDVEAWRLLGQSHAAMGALREARDSLEKAIALAPNDALTLEQHGLTLAALGDSQSALEQLGKAVQIMPRLDKSWRKLAELNEARRQLPVAIDAWRKVLGITPRERDALGRLAELCYEVADYAESLSVWRRILQDNANDVGALIGSARALAAQKRDPETVDVLRQVLRLEPARDAEANSLGQALYRLGQYEEAVTWLGQSNAKQPSADTWEMIASCLERLKRPADESEALEACLVLAPDRGPLWRRLGLLALQLGYRPRGIAALERALELGQNDATLETKLGEALRQSARELRGGGSNEEALDALTRAERFQGNDPSLFAELSVVLEQLGRPKDAIERIRRAGILVPDNQEYVLRLATLLLAEGDLQAAHQSFQRATELDRRHFEAWIGLGKTLSGLGKVRAAIEAYRTALGIRDGASADRQVMGIWLAEEGMHREAAPELERVLRENPAAIDAARWLGRCLTRLDQVEPSVQAWRAVLRMDAADVEALMGLGKALWMLAKPKEARFPLQQVSEQLESGELTLAPRGFFEYWGKVLHALGEHAPAEHALQKAIGGSVNQDESAQFGTLRAGSLVILGRFDEALRQVDELLVRAPSDAELLQLRAQALAGAGQTDAAVVALKRVVDGEGHGAEERRVAAEKLTQLYKDQATSALDALDAPRAASTLQELLLLERKSGVAGFTPQEGAGWYAELCQIYRRQGNHSGAQGAVHTALVQFPGDFRLHLIQADLWAQVGAWEEALQAYVRSTQLTPSLAAWLGQGQTLCQLQRFTDAQAALEQGLALGASTAQTATALAPLNQQLVAVGTALGDATLIVKHLEALGRARALQADESRSLGFALQAVGRYADAVEAFEAVLDERPKDGDVRFAMARALHLGQRGRAALVPLRQLVKDEPGRGEAWLELARRCVESEALDSAAEAYVQASVTLPPSEDIAREWVASVNGELDVAGLELALRYACRVLPSDYDLRLRWAKVQEDIGDTRAAMEALNAVVEQAPAGSSVGKRASLRLATLELGLGQDLVRTDPEQARWMLTRAGEHAVGDAPTVLAAVQELIDLGANAVAIQLCDRALEVTPDADDLALCLGGIATKRGEHTRAAEAYERVVGRKPDLVFALLAAGRARLAAGQPELGQVWLKRAALLDGANPEVAALLEKATSALGRADDILLAQEALIQVNPNDAALHQRYVRLLADQGHHDRVAAAVRRAESLVGPVPELLSMGARALRASGRYAEAVVWAERALAASPRNPAALRELGASQIELGELETGVASLLTARAAEPGLDLGDILPLGLVGRGRLRLQRADFDGAAADFEQALQEGAEALAVLPNMVNAARRARQLARALGAARELAELQPNPSNLAMVGELCLELGQHHEAVGPYESAVHLEPTADGFLGLGIAYYRTGDDRARATLRRAVELRPGAEAYELLANLYERTGEWSEVASSLRAVEQHRDLTSAEYPRLAMASERAGDLQGAATAWGRAVERYPGDPNALWELGRVELARGNADGAVTALQTLLGQNPHHPHASGVLGRALAKLGRSQEALTALERQAQRSADPELLKLISEQQRRLGRAASSIESLERVVQLEPHNAAAFRELSGLLLGAERFPEAVAAARRVVNLSQDDASRGLLGETLVKFAEACVERGDRGPVKTALTECVGLVGVAPPVLGSVLLVALRANENEVATRVAAELTQAEPEDPRLFQLWAQACGQRKEWLRAAAALETAVNLSLRHQAKLGRALPASLAIDSTPELLIQWARAQDQAGQMVVAAQTADRALRLGATDPGHRLFAAEVHFRVGEDYLGQGFPERALPFLERAAELNQRPADVAFTLALAHRLMGNTDRALEAARECLRVQPMHVGAFRVGKELLAQKDDAAGRERSRAWFDAYASLVAREPKLGVEYGQLLVSMAIHDEARRVLRPLVGNEHSREGASLALSDSFRATESWDQEVEVLTHAAQRGSLPSAYQRRLVEALEKVGRFDEAAVALAHLLQGEPKDLEELLKLASLEIEVKRLTNALDALERALAMQGKHLPALRMKAWVLKELNRIPERIAVLKELNKLDPQARELEALADDCLGLRRTDEAEQALAQWARLYPNESRAHLRCGLVRAQWGDPNLAIESLEQALRCDKSLDVARQRMAELFDELVQRQLVGREYREALSQSERWSRSLPKDPNAQHRRAECLQALGRLPEALALWRSVMAEYPGHAPTVQACAAQLVGTGRFDEAEAMLATALGANRDSIDLMSTLSQLYITQRKFEQAEIVANRALRLEPDNVDVLVLASQISANTARPTDAEEHLRRALRVNPNHSEANYTLGKLYLALGRMDLARTQLDKLKRINSPRADKLAARLGKP